MAASLTKILDQRVVTSTGATSGDYTSSSFTTTSGTVLVAVIKYLINGSGNNYPWEIPVPVTSGLTWEKKVGKYYYANFCADIEIWMADNPSGGSKTISQTGTGSQWDASTMAIDVTVYEATGAASVANQWGVRAFGGKNYEGANDPGAQTIYLTGPPATSSVVLASLSSFTTTASGTTPGTGWTETSEHAITGAPWLLSQDMTRSGSTDIDVTWADVQAAAGSDSWVWQLIAIEIVASGSTPQPGTLIPLVSFGTRTTAIGTGPFPPFQPPPNSTVFLAGTVGPSGGSVTYTPDLWNIVGSGLTWASVAGINATHTFGSTYSHNYAVWSATVGASPSLITGMVFDPFPDATESYYALFAYAIIGAPTLVQSATDGAGDNADAQTLTFGAAATGGNLVIAQFGCGNNTPLTPMAVPSGWYPLLNEADYNYAALSLFYRWDFTGTSVTCTDMGLQNGTRGGVLTEWSVPAAGATFVTGRMWDDENGTDTVGPLVDGDYTEVEWNLKLQSPAADTEIYQFRVQDGTTAFEDYAVTPQITVTAAAGVNYDETGRSVLIAAATTATDIAHRRDLGLSIPVAVAVTATDVIHRKELTLSVPIAAAVTAGDVIHRKELALSVPVAATTTGTDRLNNKELALSVPVDATVTRTDVHTVGGVGFNETGRQVPITATVTVTDQADFKELTTTVAVTATVTTTVEKASLKALAQPIDVVATTTAVVTKQAHKELGLATTVTASTTLTEAVKRRELALSSPGTVTTTLAVDQADFHSTALSIPVVVTTTATDKAKRLETALSVPVAATTTLTVDKARYRDLPVSVPVAAFTTTVDLQQSPGHYDETQRSIVIAATTTLAVDQTDYDQLGLSIPATVATTATDVAHRRDLGLAITATATVTSAQVKHHFETVTIPVTATTTSPTDRARYRDLPVNVPIAATVTMSDLAAPRLENVTLLVTATVSATDRSSYKQLALPVDVTATTTATTGLHSIAALTFVIIAAVKVTDVKSKTGVVVLNEADAIYLGDLEVSAVYVGADRAWP